MLVYAGLIPHLPITDIHDPHATTQALEVLDLVNQVSKELYASKPDTIIFISQHPHHHGNGIYFNINHEIAPSFKELGDLSDRSPVITDLEFVTRIQSRITQNEYILLHESQLDDITSFGIHFLTSDIKPKPTVVKLSCAHQTLDDIKKYSEILYDSICDSNNRIVVIGIGNGSAASTDTSLFGHKEEGIAFQKKLTRAIPDLSEKSLQALEKLAHGAYQDIMIPLAYLFYITQNIGPKFVASPSKEAMGVMTQIISLPLRS